MTQNSNSGSPKSLSRRAALRRLAGFVTAAYVVPEVALLSEVRASSTASTPSSEPTPLSVATAPSSPASTVSLPSSPNPSTGTASSNAPGDSCQISGPSGAGAMSISRSDLRRAQEAVEGGYAQPLENIWGNFTQNYNGRIIGIEFTGAPQAPQYRFRAISRLGRLETVTISAQTGDILRIVGC